MKIINVPALALTSKERGKIIEVVSMLYNTDNEVDDFLENVMKNMRGCSLLGVLEEILNRAQISD